MANLPRLHRYDVYGQDKTAVYRPRFGVAQDQPMIATASEIEDILSLMTTYQQTFPTSFTPSTIKS